jgi:glutaredoxin
MLVVLLVLLALPARIAWGAAPAPASAPSSTPASAPATATDAVLTVYVREGCPHCADAKRFLPELAARRPGLRIALRPVDADPVARDELTVLSRAVGSWPPGVPTFVYGKRVLVGFDTAETTGQDLLAMIDEADRARGATPPAAAPRGEVESPLFGTLSASRLGLPLFTLALGLLDGFNPCAMWVLLFLLSLLVRTNDRRRMALIAGTFVLVSGLVYYAFMAAWLNIFLAVGMSEAVRIGLALLALLIGALNLKDFVAFGRGPSLSIPAGARPGIVARMHRLRDARSLPAMLLGVSALALVVNFVELLCTAGLPAVYTAVLTQQQLAPWAYHTYLGLYIVGYAADDALMVTLAVTALGSGKLSERAGKQLKLLSGLVMLALGLVLLLRPQWLL